MKQKLGKAGKKWKTNSRLIQSLVQMKQAQASDIHCCCISDICWDNNWAGYSSQKQKGWNRKNQRAMEGGNPSYRAAQDNVAFPHFIVAWCSW